MNLPMKNEKKVSGKNQSGMQNSRGQKPHEYLYRIMSIHELISMVEKNSFILADPQFWPDEVDSKMMETYNKKMGGHLHYALCFTKKEPDSLMWQVYGKNAYSICIRFNAAEMEKFFKAENKSTQLKNVDYLNKKDRYVNQYEMYPFIKRKWFEEEDEVRLISIKKEIALENRTTLSKLISSIMISPFSRQDLLKKILKEKNLLNKARTSKIFRDDDFLKTYCPDESEFKKEAENA